MAEGDIGRIIRLHDDADDVRRRLLDYGERFDVDTAEQAELLAGLMNLLSTFAAGSEALRRQILDQTAVVDVFAPMVKEMRATLTDRATSAALTERLRRDMSVALHQARQVIVAEGDDEERELALPNLADLAQFFDLTETDEAAVRAQHAQRAAEESAARAREAAGDTGTHVLAGGFQAVTTKEKDAADRYRWATILLLLVSAGESAYFALDAEGLETPQLLARLTIAVPLLALAAYLGRESAQHRQFSNSYRFTAVQLQSVAAFADMLPDDRGYELIHDLGKAVYTGPPTTLDRDDLATPTIPLVELIPLLQGLTGRPAET